MVFKHLGTVRVDAQAQRPKEPPAARFGLVTTGENEDEAVQLELTGTDAAPFNTA